MPQTINPSELLRYERKFLITDYSYADVEQFVKFHPACFSPIFQQRSVNNIYFDTLGMNNYNDNVEGQTQRSKVRIRWYGNLFGSIDKPVLEYKIKNGLVGKKRSFLLNPFILDESFGKSHLIAAVRDMLPDEVKNEILSLRPTLLNCYKRKYFLSADKNFRITIDHHLAYYKIDYDRNTFLNKSEDVNSTVLELKYDIDYESQANLIASSFPFALTKNSKYLQGLERIFI
jgi:SPX domain protein involved in polyphosphate accumulation